MEELERELLPSLEPYVDRVYVHLAHTIHREDGVGEDTRVSHHLLMPAKDFSQLEYHYRRRGNEFSLGDVGHDASGSNDNLLLCWTQYVQVILIEPRQIQERVAALHLIGESIDEAHHKLYLQAVDSDDEEESEVKLDLKITAKGAV